ncbi:hypothetical protein D9619_011195 [Psilocybe cf. subviscida]|uniref:Uncharacterized protein n=1 Tax=Psilocybe cf. subviscida TaxID=2480587 RepID=A0A8H5F5T1_9AGAR|nr:hypothetical protein D9619_011195 [Psilocybe cf. subviscida]
MYYRSHLGRYCLAALYDLSASNGVHFTDTRPNRNQDDGFVEDTVLVGSVPNASETDAVMHWRMFAHISVTSDPSSPRAPPFFDIPTPSPAAYCWEARCLQTPPPRPFRPNLLPASSPPCTAHAVLLSLGLNLSIFRMDAVYSAVPSTFPHLENSGYELSTDTIFARWMFRGSSGSRGIAMKTMKGEREADCCNGTNRFERVHSSGTLMWHGMTPWTCANGRNDVAMKLHSGRVRLISHHAFYNSTIDTIITICLPPNIGSSCISCLVATRMTTVIHLNANDFPRRPRWPRLATRLAVLGNTAVITSTAIATTNGAAHPDPSNPQTIHSQPRRARGMSWARPAPRWAL